ncbi:hypothetical protein PInf_016614 [Phytophthora infestans]|nr:hypothetical protein PInf_016614 [Phytophthora infestans]
MIDSEEYGSHVNAGPPKRLDIQAHEWREYRLVKRQVGLEEHVLWVCRTNKLIPSVATFRRGWPQSIRLTNVSDQTVYLPAHDSIAMWIPDGDLPREDSYVRLDSKKYQDWQVLVYEGCRDRELVQRECEIYEQWLAIQPSAVERPDYPEPSGVLTRPLGDSLMDSSDRLTCAERWALIMKERERVEAGLASGVTAGDSAEGQYSEEPLATYTTAHGGGNIANEASVARTHELLSPVNVVHTPTSVRLKSGVTAEGTSNSTGFDGVASFDEVGQALCAAQFANESSVVGLEDEDIALKVANTAPSVHCKMGANAELSRQRPTEALNKSQQPNMSVARAFNIANKDSADGPEMGNQDGKEMDPVPNVELKEDVDFESREGSVATLDETYISVARVLATEGNEVTKNARNDFYEHPANNIGLQDYAKELAFLSDLTEEINTTIGYNAPNLSTDRTERLVPTLQNHEHILIASGNALPPPAYGAVCDIDTQVHAPIKQRCRRVSLRFLGKLLLALAKRRAYSTAESEPEGLPAEFSDKEMGSESDPAPRFVESSEDDEDEESDWSDGSGPPNRSSSKRTPSAGPYLFTLSDEDADDDDDDDESPEDSEEARTAEEALEEDTRRALSQSRSEARRRSLSTPPPQVAGTAGSGGATAGSAIRVDSDGGSGSDGGRGSPHGGGLLGSGGGGAPGGGSPGSGGGGSPHGGGSPGSPHGGGSPGSPHGGGSPGSVLIPAPPNSSLPGMLPVAPFGPDAAFIPGRRAPVAFAARDIEPWSAKKLNRVAIISMKITVLFPELPFRAEWIFPRTADAIPRAGYVDSLITRPLVEELTSAAPWDTLVTTPVDPVSFRGDVRGRLGVFVRAFWDFASKHRVAIWEGTHRFPISRNQLQGSTWLSNFNKQRGNRRSHAGRAWKRVLVILVLAIQDGWCDVDILLDPSFLHLPRRGDKVAWFPGSVSRQANLEDPNLHRPEPTSLLEALREIDEAEPWRIQFRGDLSQHPGRQIQRLVSKFFNVQPKTT